ncbi:unnamed protein product [Aureobasidium vineae]|uniref:C4-dicarboxylate transporter/malic acid transport protein n=1 Tax=Aureobasidium vineae TaxID=2773715 RepID=A0A9N8PEL9_9PEZI|nr:unnamed protein product [Aureobasidium vineae]
MATSRFSTEQSDDSNDFVVPWSYVDPDINDDGDTEQHKAHRNQQLYKRSIRHYRHATTKWGAALESFNPLWFAVCISAGGIALVLNGPFPYRGHWLIVLATILYIAEIVLFFTFLALLLAKWIIYPHVAVRRALTDSDELGTYAIPPIALMTIAALTITQVSEGPWGGHAFTLVGYVVWWIGVAWVFVTALVVLSVLFYTGNQSARTMTPVLFMAPVGLATAAAEAGLITIYGAEMSSRLAVPQLIVGYFAAGVAFFMAILLYTVFFHHLLSVGWGPAPKRAGLFILIAPCGQLATAFQLLGESASAYMRFAQYKPSAVNPPAHGTFWTESTAQGVDGAGIFFALLLLGFDYLWLCIAIIGVADIFVKKQATYTLVWWATVFPTVTLTTAWLELASSMDSPAFRGLVCALTVFLVIAFFVNLGFTLRGLFNGSLIFGKSQLEIEEGMMKKAQDGAKSRRSEV